MSFLRTIDDVTEALKNAKKRNINVNLIIGAGCSVTANIPTAAGFVELIRKRYIGEYNRCETKDYPTCMSKLTPSERRNLIIDIVNKAKINMTHIAIAQLMKKGFINRILTTNFDNLVQRSCALVNEFPAIYDLASSSSFRADLLFDKSVIHLHGQHTGFILCNTKQEVEAQFKSLEGVFNNLNQGSLWIIVGYSGENDPIYKMLAREKLFENRLYWIGYRDNEPSQKVVDEILGEEKYGFYVKGFNSDDFFVNITRRLDCFPVEIISTPFTYLKDSINNIVDYSLPLGESFLFNTDIKTSTQKMLVKSIEAIESDPELLVDHYAVLGMHDELLRVFRSTDGKVKRKLTQRVEKIFSESKKILKEECDRLANVYNEFPEDKLNLINWAKLLNNMSLVEKDPSEKARLKSQEIEKYELASKIDLNYEIMASWSDALIKLAELQDDENDKLNILLESAEKISIALSLSNNDLKIIKRSINVNEMLFEIYTDFDTKKEYINVIIEAINTALEIDPNDERTLIQLGVQLIAKSDMFFRNGEPFENLSFLLRSAIEVLNKVLVLDPTNNLALHKMAEAYYRYSLYLENNNRQLSVMYLNESCEKLREALKISNKNETRMLLAKTLQSLSTYYEDEEMKTTTLIESLHNVGLCTEHSKNSILDWIDTLNTFVSEVDIKKHQGVIKENLKSIVSQMGGLSFDSDDFVERPINSLCYSLISKGYFEGVINLLETEVKYTSDFMVRATKGMYYLRNSRISIRKAEVEGTRWYTTAQNMLLDESQSYERALKQKYYYEMGLFNLSRKKDYLVANEFLSKAYELGEIEDFEDLYADTVVLLSSLSGSETTIQLTAASGEDISSLVD